MRDRPILAIAAAALALLAGCASTSPKKPFADVSRTVAERTGHTIRWNQATDDDKDAESATDAILARELTVDGAVQVALLGNPSLQADLEELAVSHADLVQAGLLSNPSFTIGRTAWEMEHLDPNLFVSVEQSFLDVVTLPLRKRVAATELEQTKLEIGDRVLALTADVRTAFFTAQAAEQVAAMRRLVEQAATASAEVARRQHAAGNMNDLALNTELALAAQTMLDRRRAEGEAAVAREKLNKLMGTWGPRTAWKTGQRLPELPGAEPSLEHLESSAVAQRLDISAARRSVQAMSYTLGLAKTTRWVGSVSVGLDVGRLSHNQRLSFGPRVTLEIPLFDQRQAQIARLEAYLRRAEKQLEAIAIDVRADVRSARARVTTTRGVVEDYGKVMVPLRENVVRFSQEQYDAMLLGVYQLIQAKQAEFDTYREYIEALRDYWIARSDLERAVGRRIGATPPPTSHPRGLP